MQTDRVVNSGATYEDEFNKIRIAIPPFAF